MRWLPVAVLSIALTGCETKNPFDDKMARPGETVQAQLRLPEAWQHGQANELSARFLVPRVGRAEPILLEAEFLPEDFRPEIRVSFTADDQPVGTTVVIPFRADC